MKNYFYILILKSQITALKSERGDMLVRICAKYKESSKIDNLETIMPEFFEEIDAKIESRSRLLRLLKKKQSSSFSLAVFIF